MGGLTQLEKKKKRKVAFKLASCLRGSSVDTLITYSYATKRESSGGSSAKTRSRRFYKGCGNRCDEYGQKNLNKTTISNDLSDPVPAGMIEAEPGISATVNKNPNASPIKRQAVLTLSPQSPSRVSPRFKQNRK